MRLPHTVHPISPTSELPWKELLFVAFLAIIIYANTLTNGFVNDDQTQVLKNPWIKDARFIPDILTKNVWSFVRGFSNYYRPMMHLIYFAEYHLFGYKAWGYHAVNILFHVLNVFMVYLLTAQLLGSGKQFGSFVSPALIVAALFATHPIHTEAVAWIASIPELSFSFFYLLSFYLYVKERRILAAFAFLASLFCKETALTLPFVLFAYDSSFGREGNYRNESLASTQPSPFAVTEKGSLLPALTRYIPFASAACVYLFMRHMALSGKFIPISVQQLNTCEAILNIFPIFFEYLRSMIWPIPLNFWHTFHPISSLFSIHGIVSVMIALLYLFLLAATWKKRKAVFMALLLFLVPLLPAFYLKGLSGKPFAERYLYLPSFGFLLLLGIAATASMRNLRKIVLVILICITFIYSVLTIIRNRVWLNDDTLIADTLEKSPGATTLRHRKGINLFISGRIDEAIAEFRIVLQDDPDNAACHADLGAALVQKGLLDSAIQQLEFAIRLDPTLPEAYNGLGLALWRKGLASKAIHQFQYAIYLNPQSADVEFNLAAVLAESGRAEEALQHYEAAVNLAPENAYYRNALGIEYGKRGLSDKAIEQFRAAVRLDPAEPAYKRNLEHAYKLK